MRIRKAGVVLPLLVLLFLFFCPIAGHAYYFNDEFSRDLSEDIYWEVHRDGCPPQELYVDTSSGELVVGKPNEISRGFPYLISKTQVFPEEGDFELTIRFKYMSMYGDTGILVLTEDNKYAGMGIWTNFSVGYVQVYCGLNNSGSPDYIYIASNIDGGAYQYHTVTYRVHGQTVKLFVDGTEKFTFTLPRRPAKIRIGLPTTQSNRWSTFRVDYIRVKRLHKCQCQNGDIFCLCDHQGNVIPNGSTLQYGHLYCIGTGAQKVEAKNVDNRFHLIGKWCNEDGTDCHSDQVVIPDTGYDPLEWIDSVTPSEPHCFVLNSSFGDSPSPTYTHKWMKAEQNSGDTITVNVTTDTGTTEQQINLSDYFNFRIADEEGIQQILHLYDEQGNIVPIGGQIRAGKTYKFAAAKDSGIDKVDVKYDYYTCVDYDSWGRCIEHKTFTYGVRFAAYSCKEDETDCKFQCYGKEAYELGELEVHFSSECFNPPDSEHTLGIIRLEPESTNYDYRATLIFDENGSETVPFDPHQFKYRVLSCDTPSSFTKLNGTGYAPYATTLNVEGSGDQTYTFVIKKDGQEYRQVSIEPSYYFDDEFSSLDTTKWEVHQNNAPSSELYVDNGELVVGEAGNSYLPALVSKTDVFPDGDFDLEVRFKYTRVSSHGDGIKAKTQNNQFSGIGIWGDTAQRVRVYYGSNYHNISSDEWHTAVYQVRGQTVTVFVDGTQVGSFTLQNRPEKLTIGNLAYGGSISGSWSGFKVDYIRIKQPDADSGSSVVLTEPGTYSATLVVACSGGQDELPAGEVTVQENPVSISLSGEQNPLALTSETYTVEISGNSANNHFTGTIKWPDGTENSLDFTDAQVISSKDITFTSTEQKKLSVQICIPEVEEQTGEQYCLSKELVINPVSPTPQISISTGKSSNFVGETPPDSATVTFNWDSQHRDSITQQFTLEFALKKGSEVIFSDQKSFTASDDSVDITFSDSALETLSTTAGSYTLYAKVYPEGHEDMAEDASMTYTVQDISVSLSIDGPTGVDITQSQTAQFTVNAQISPQNSPYTLAQATYSIPELNISDQPVENGTITINLSQAGKTRLTINAKVCIQGLTDRCAEDHKILAVSVPEPAVSITCPQEARAGEEVTCTAEATADYGTAQISWLVDGQAVEGDGNELTYAFSQAGDHTITAVASLAEFPDVSTQAQASISITNPQIQISVLCIPADTFSDLWHDDGICALRDADGSVRISLSGSIHSLTLVISVQDANGNTIATKTITDGSDTVDLTAQDLGISELLAEKELTIQATLQEAPDVTDSGQISVILVPPDPQFETSHEVTAGKATIHISIPDYSEQTYGSTWSAYVRGQRSTKVETTDSVDFSDGSVDVEFPFWDSGQYKLFPVVELRAKSGQTLKTYNLAAIDVEASMGNPIRISLKSFPAPEGFAPFSTTIRAYISPGDVRKVKGLEWFLDGESIAGSSEEVVNSVELTFDEPGEHTLSLKAYHSDSDQVDDIQGITLKALAVPPDVQDAFELSLTYTRDKKVQVREKKLLKSDQLVTSPVREKLEDFSWEVVDENENTILSGTSNLTRWTIDMSNVDLSKDYRLIAYWHTSIGRDFIASADIDEGMIKSKGMDLSKAEIRFSKTSWYHQFYLGGVSSTSLRLANLNVHFQAVNSDDEVFKEADSLLRLTKDEIPQGSYTVKCEVTDRDSGEILWQGEKQVDGSGSNNNDTKNNNNNNTNNSDDEEYAEKFANEPILVCYLLDPFDKRVRCIIDHMYHLGYFRVHGYEVSYCISVDEQKVCGKRRVDFTFQNGGDKQFTMDFTYSKGEESNAVTKSVTLHIPDSLEEILGDPEKGMALDVQIVDPILNKVKAVAYLKDRYYSSAFSRRYLFQLRLLDSQGQEIFKPKRGRYFFYYEIPPSYEEQYTVVAEVYPKDDPDAESVYEKQADFSIQTLRDNMAELIVEKPEHRKNDPWGVYKFTVKINPPQISKYLGWDVILKDSQEQEVERFERTGRKVLRVPAPGTYTFLLKVYAKDDPETIFLEKSQQITAENQKPEVSITNIETSVDYRGRHNLLVEIDYSDPDGRIKEVEVNACGYEKPKHYKRNVFDCGENASTEVSIRVCDDAGECTELSQPVQWQ